MRKSDAKAAEALPLQAEGFAPGEPAKADILLVDDQDENLLALESVLQDLGQNLTMARSGQEALRLLFNRDFAVILLDVRMPDLDGFETAEVIRSRNRSKCTPIILITAADAEPEHISRGYGVGAIDFIFKPFAPEVLKAKVRIFLELFQKSRELQAEILQRRRFEEDRRRMLAQLLQGQKLQAVGQLSAGIAHEINNPTAWILSNMGTLGRYLDRVERFVLDAEQAIQKFPAPGDPQLTGVKDVLSGLRNDLDSGHLLGDFRAAIEDCRGGAERIRDIVRNLKDFSHVDEARLMPSDVQQLLESALQLCRNEMKYRATVHRDYGKVGKLLCFPQQIEQVLVNLLVNAAQSLNSKGDIFIHSSEEAGNAVIQIRDTGVGISHQNLERLFEPFFTTKPVGKGTGLGLHVAHKIVEAHGGSIEARSEPGQGAQFVVRLPLKGPPARK